MPWAARVPSLLNTGFYMQMNELDAFLDKWVSAEVRRSPMGCITVDTGDGLRLHNPCRCDKGWWQVKIDRAWWWVVGLRRGAPHDSPVFLLERADPEGASTGLPSDEYSHVYGGW